MSFWDFDEYDRSEDRIKNEPIKHKGNGLVVGSISNREIANFKHIKEAKAYIDSFNRNRNKQRT